MLKKVFITLIALAFNFLLLANNNKLNIGAPQAGMGFNGTSSCNLWSAYYNQAGLAFLQEKQVGLCYQNNFGIKELGLKSGVFVLPTYLGTFALNISQFGYTSYSENNFGLSYSKLLSKDLALGIKFSCINTHLAEDYGNKWTPIAELGIIYKLTNNIKVGAHIFNLNRGQVSSYTNEKIPTYFNIGCSYDVEKKVIISSEIEKDLENKAIYKIGLEYKLFNNLCLRTGINSSKNNLCFGIGYIFRNFKADMAFSYHQVLGMSPHFSLSYNFK